MLYYYMFENCFFLIPARRDSKGFPFKNRKLFDKTASIIPKSLRSKVYVSTNDEIIKQKCINYGFNLVNRPENLATDESSLKCVMKHFITTHKVSKEKNIVLLFLTYPERTWKDVVKIYKKFILCNRTSLVCAEPVTEHPFLCFYEKGNGEAELVVKHNLFRRQDYPKCHKHSMFLSCYKAKIVDELHDLLFEKQTYFHKLENKKTDVDYEEDYIDSSR